MLKIEELEKQVNSNNIKGIYLLYGEETYLLDQMLKKNKETIWRNCKRNKLYSNIQRKYRITYFRNRNTIIWIFKKINNSPKYWDF